MPKAAKLARLGLATTLAALALASPALAQGPTASGFDWFANAAPVLTPEQLTAQERLVAEIRAQGTWICSPAGFGRRSVCYAG